MKWMGLNELRETYLSFYEERGHYRLPSFSLVPKDDNSLLLINSGMAPMKKYFVGDIEPPSRRVTTCQKCIRTIDIDNVGFTSRHLTYFEMLGNFSFGDYKRPQAQAWAWELFHEKLGIPAELLYISVYEKDDYAYEVWTQEIGIAPSRMVRLGKEDNFWEHGSGPCGPCSEIYFDRGEENGCGDPHCAPGCDCDRFVEIGNIVFTELNSDGNGNYTPLEKPNIDFGMGLERLAMVIQGVSNVFLVDTIQDIIRHVAKIAGKTYGEDDKNDISLRIIADHIRSICFMIGDGVLPANDGRGYVLRRLLRRAARHGKLLGIDGVFLTEVVDTVIQANRDSYPELFEKQGVIRKVVGNEEESFARTIDQGLSMLNQLMEKVENSMFSGEQAFLLNDTYGFPLDLTKEILSERHMAVDEKRFMELMREQRERARNARKDAGADAWKGEGDAADGLNETVFTGYESLCEDTKVIAIIKGGAQISAAQAGDEVTLVLEKTPFYAESGGQVGDTGTITLESGTCEVAGTTKTARNVYLHHAVVEEGLIETGVAVTAAVDTEKRKAIKRNHTAAHLLQAALRQVLGEHVTQAGQLVDDEHCRFDFTHFSALTKEELAQVEELINDKILDAIPVEVREMPVSEAKEMGAMALFGEKYGDIVRVVSIDDFSREFCGGTHVDNTAKLGLIKLQSETSVASGVRRIEAVTGKGVLQMLNNFSEMVLETAREFKMNNLAAISAKAHQIMTELRDKDKMIEKLNSQLASSSVESLFQNASDTDGIKVISGFFPGTGVEELKAMCDKVKDHEEAVVAVVAGAADGKVSLVASANKAAQQLGVKAGQLVKEVAILTGGNGGGRPDFAMAGVKDAGKLDSALQSVAALIKKIRTGA